MSRRMEDKVDRGQGACADAPGASVAPEGRTEVAALPYGLSGSGDARLLMLQLGDSALPVGGYAFSSGLESLARLGLLTGLESFKTYLEDYLMQLAAAEGAFLNSFLGLLPSGPEAELQEALDEWDAFLTNAPARRASRVQARAWASLLRGLVPGEAAHGLRRLGPSPHFLPVFALATRLVHFCKEEAWVLLFHTALRDQLGAAVRLNLLGPMQGLILQRDMQALWSRFREEAAGRDYRTAVRQAPLLELAQCRHAYLYTRLFQS